MTESRPDPATVPAMVWPRPPWAVPPRPGTRYDQLACTPLHRWWRPLLGTLLIVLGFLVVSLGVAVAAMAVSILTGTPLLRGGSRLFGDPLLDLGFQLSIIALTIPLVFAAAWLVQRRPPGTLSSVAGRLRWGWLIRCLPVAVAAVLLGQAAEIGALLITGVDPGIGWAGWETFLPALIVIVVLVPFQSAAEEYIFRGWIIQTFGTYLPMPWPGILLGSATFAALHGYTDWGIAYVFGFGVLTGWLAVFTGGLEAPIALHVTNNVVAFGAVAASGDLDSALNQGSLPWQSMAGTLIQFAVYGSAIVFIAGKWRVQTVSR